MPDEIFPEVYALRAEEFRERHDLPHGFVYFSGERAFAWSLDLNLTAFAAGVIFAHTVQPGIARILGPETCEILTER